MNVGYTSSKNAFKSNPICPLCGSDVYGAKFGGNFTCTNQECPLKSASANELIEAIETVKKQL